MGAVLAMMRFRQGAAALMILTLGSCGPLANDGVAMQLVSAVADIAMGDNGAEAAAPPPLASEEEMASAPGQFMRVNFRNLGRWDTLVAAASNGDRVTWIGNANLSVTLQDSIVVATRGLPRDLMGAEPGDLRAAMRAGGGQTQRAHDFMDDQDQITTRVLQCRIASQGKDTFERAGAMVEAERFEERCTSDLLEFTNVYWTNRRGDMLRSLQAVSPGAGYLQIDVY
jgi:hypothetical protein